MRRNILLITTDQQRFDSLGVNGGAVARTPVADGLAERGLNYTRAHCQNTVCSPARSTILTGQYPRTHGVIQNGIALPPDAPTVAGYLRARADYRTALIGKAHFEPNIDKALLAPDFDGSYAWPENRMAGEGSTGPYRGFDHFETACHGYWKGQFHYDHWLDQNHPGASEGFYAFDIDDRNATFGDTGAPDTRYNPMPVEAYHTDWVAQRTIDVLQGFAVDDNWFVWMSFPDPHSPWDPPESAAREIPWQELELPVGHPGSIEATEAILANRPRQWMEAFDAAVGNQFGPPYEPRQLSHDMVREINALVHAENELIDRACGRVLDEIDARGWCDRTDVFFTTDHGEMQGDFGLIFKGPFHVDALMRLPFIWQPAPVAAVTPAEVPEPVGQVDLAPTFCEIAGLPVPDWMQGNPLPAVPGSSRERVLTEWDWTLPGYDYPMRSIFRDGLLCTVYEPSEFCDGTEGELYDVSEDPLQRINLWDDPARAALRSDLVADLRDSLVEPRAEELPVESIF
ncbi:MAG: sulfatase-like hydrolase/transferase [Acidimicrobiia bacterium]